MAKLTKILIFTIPSKLHMKSKVEGELKYVKMAKIGPKWSKLAKKVQNGRKNQSPLSG